MSTGRRVSIDQPDDLFSKLTSDVTKAIQRGLHSAGYRLVGHIVSDVIPSEPRMPVDKGIYRSAWRVTELKGKKGGVFVHNNAPHAGFIENGVMSYKVKPGRYMILALYEWIIRKGLVKKTAGGAQSDSNTQAYQMAWAIAKSMKRKGIFNYGAGLKILEKGTAMLPKFIQEEVARELAKLAK